MPSGADVAMRQWLLTFHDPAIEAAFDRQRLGREYRPADLRFFFVTTVVMLACSVKTMYEHERRILPAMPFALCGVLTVLMWHRYLRCSAEEVLKQRPYMSALFRISVAVAGSVSSRYIFWMFALMPNAPFVALQFLMASETFGNLPYAFGMTLNFRHHLPTHCVAYLIFLFGKAPVMCEKISHSAGAAIFYELEAHVDAFLELCYAFLESLTGSPSVVAPKKAPCLHLSAFLMTFYSIGFVSFVLWRSEKRSRTEFFECYTRSSPSRGSAPKPSGQSPDCVICLIVLSLAAIFWRCTASLTQFLVDF